MSENYASGKSLQPVIVTHVLIEGDTAIVTFRGPPADIAAFHALLGRRAYPRQKESEETEGKR